MLQICLLGASLKIKDLTRRCGAAAEGRLRDRRCAVRLRGLGDAIAGILGQHLGQKERGTEMVRLVVL